MSVARQTHTHCCGRLPHSNKNNKATYLVFKEPSPELCRPCALATNRTLPHPRVRFQALLVAEQCDIIPRNLQVSSPLWAFFYDFYWTDGCGINDYKTRLYGPTSPRPRESHPLVLIQRLPGNTPEGSAIEGLTPRQAAKRVQAPAQTARAGVRPRFSRVLAVSVPILPFANGVPGSEQRESHNRSAMNTMRTPPSPSLSPRSLYRRERRGPAIRYDTRH